MHSLQNLLARSHMIYFSQCLNFYAGSILDIPSTSNANTSAYFDVDNCCRGGALDYSLLWDYTGSKQMCAFFRERVSTCSSCFGFGSMPLCPLPLMIGMLSCQHHKRDNAPLAQHNTDHLPGPWDLSMDHYRHLRRQKPARP